MGDKLMLVAMRHGSEGALQKAIDKYAAYVCVIIRNIVGEVMAREDIEEAASDVFFALWENAGKIKKLKPWLGTTARNKALNKLRCAREALPLDEALTTGDNETKKENYSNFQREAGKNAVLSMESPDKEIFLSYYFKGQNIAEISAETGQTEAAIKHRLVRGRKKLKPIVEGEV
jgi:RNA polymerase sigma-70 factor (ECF subfamily)